MPGFVFVCDAQGTPLMPMSPAYARKLLQSGKAILHPHHAFSVLNLTRTVEMPTLRPVVLAVAIHLHTAELFLVAEGDHHMFPLLYLIVDLRTDLPWRLRRRAAHRRRRRRRDRYRTARRFGRPFALRRPCLMHSRWSAAIRTRRQHTRSGRRYVAPTIRWRTQAIVRTIHVLSKIVPISDVILLSPQRTPMPKGQMTDLVERRQQLIEAYGVLGARGERIAACAYCGTTEGRIGVDHILPRSRGGTDAWHNLVLACRPCNERKGERTPEEAGMSLRIPPAAPQRMRPYTRQTAALLWSMLTQIGPRCGWPSPGDALSEVLSSELCTTLAAFATQPTVYAAVTVAKPVSRARKQRFTARNYPLSTRLEASMVRVGQTIKRRVRVNRGLLIEQQEGRTVTRVLRSDDEMPDAGQRLITIGMLCEARRAGKLLTGVVSAVHSDGRLTLLTPRSAHVKGVVWDRVLVRPAIHLRVITSDRVLFLPIPPDMQAAQEYSVSGE